MKSMKSLQKIRYQEDAIEEMLRKVDTCISENEKEFLFQAPTGSGKTITMGRFFQEYFKKHQHEKVGFIWLSPGKGQLADQSKQSMDAIFNHYFNSINLNDMRLNRQIRNKDVVFINWEAVNKKDNVAMREGERINVREVIENTRLDKLIIVVDESHEGRNSTKALEVLEVFNGDIVIDVTATPRNSAVYNKFNTVKIDIDDVIEAGFIKKQVILNEDLKALDVHTVLKTALDKRDEIERAYRQYEPNCKTPLMLVQIENDRAVETELGKMPRAEVIRQQLIQCGLKDEDIAIWVSDKKVCQNLTNIKTSDIKVLIFKSAIATGYDIDRAHILVKLRDAKSEVFNTQVLGRILRTQFKKFYDNELVDSAYVFTEFNTYEYKLDMDDDLKDKLKKPRLEARIKAEFKKDMPKFTIPMYKKETEYEHSLQSALLRKRIDIELSTEFIASLDYDPSGVTDEILTGKLESKSMLNDGYFNSLKGEFVYKDDYAIKDAYVRAIKKLSKYVDVRHMVAKSIQRDSRINHWKDAMILYLQNKDLIETRIIDAINAYFELTMARSVVEMKYSPLETVYYRGVQDVTNAKYAYTLEPDLSTASTRSSSEQLFADYLNKNDNVLYWYKNENNGLHFSVNYINSERDVALYYPDFIIITKEMKLIVVDVKAPIKQNKTKDIADVSAKYDAGKLYERQHKSDILEAGFTDMEFSMIKLRDDVPYICKSNKYSDKFEDSMIWSRFEV